MLKDAPGGAQYLAAPRIRSGRSTSFAETAHRATRASGAEGMLIRCSVPHGGRDAPTSSPTLLSDDRRKSVTTLGTNIARAVGSNAIKGNIWDNFSSESYKELPAVGTFTNLYNPRDPDKPIRFEMPGGGRGYYRTASLTSIWATAPFLHNNSVGVFVKDPSVQGRMTAFNDAIVKMLWPERRLGVQSIPVTTVESFVTVSGTARKVRIPAGTPVDYVARVDPTRLPDVIRRSSLLNFFSDESIYRRMLGNNAAPDFVLDRGHVFGAGLSDDDKWALIEFLKTF